MDYPAALRHRLPAVHVRQGKPNSRLSHCLYGTTAPSSSFHTTATLNQCRGPCVVCFACGDCAPKLFSLTWKSLGKRNQLFKEIVPDLTRTLYSERKGNAMKRKQRAFAILRTVGQTLRGRKTTLPGLTWPVHFPNNIRRSPGFYLSSSCL
jgi:hypothetical protein